MSCSVRYPAAVKFVIKKLLLVADGFWSFFPVFSPHVKLLGKSVRNEMAGRADGFMNGFGTG